ncbi:hypothetical protein SPRG_10027 [Saprolegnia parasitica CBS 223.65]|uniref:Uncharacterized protein n=1 Tax=Saprolegnia parasitica (strain CBS 223.65) TaxID=695850 RepID=A0A067CAN3_SAPPC|nr:hypothetical protein SPRG_10027 [Saprolegnia parasitica CBS 223.65]KDO23882.1 hypothetical protein SPRG_10027 [Saprolegnia parasitica CBS 223.65]|eukprot:XP_012205352.1 hypothetical protein SPRG_10027 [Saprolegnia parasitica CBS 223.65]
MHSAEDLAELAAAIAHVQQTLARLQSKEETDALMVDVERRIDAGASTEDLLVLDLDAFPRTRALWAKLGPALPTELLEAFAAYKAAYALEKAKTTEDVAPANHDAPTVDVPAPAAEAPSPASIEALSDAAASQDEEPLLEEVAPAEEDHAITAPPSTDEREVMECSEDVDGAGDTEGDDIISQTPQDESEPPTPDEPVASASIVETPERKLSDAKEASSSNHNTPQRASSRIRGRADTQAAASPKASKRPVASTDDVDSESDVVPLVHLRKRSAPTTPKGDAKSSESESPPKRTSGRASRAKAPPKDPTPPARSSTRKETKTKKGAKKVIEDESEESEVTPSRRKSTRRVATRKRKINDSD